MFDVIKKTSSLPAISLRLVNGGETDETANSCGSEVLMPIAHCPSCTDTAAAKHSSDHLRAREYEESALLLSAEWDTRGRRSLASLVANRPAPAASGIRCWPVSAVSNRYTFRGEPYCRLTRYSGRQYGYWIMSQSMR